MEERRKHVKAGRLSISVGAGVVVVVLMVALHGGPGPSAFGIIGGPPGGGFPDVPCDPFTCSPTSDFGSPGAGSGSSSSPAPKKSSSPHTGATTCTAGGH